MEELYLVIGRKYGGKLWHIVPKLLTEAQAVADARSRFIKNRGLNNGLGYEYQVVKLVEVSGFSSNGHLLDEALEV